jgi:hypothetical protein
MDPINDPDFNLYTKRDPNPQTIAELRKLADAWRWAEEEASRRREKLDACIVKAKDTGHSFSQIRKATGLGTGSIQMILAKAGRL